jgi:hypothetical protein
LQIDADHNSAKAELTEFYGDAHAYLLGREKSSEYNWRRQYDQNQVPAQRPGGDSM